MNPDFKFNVVTLNRFTESKECQLHKDKDNVGNSRIIFLGDFVGGALWLADGRRFDCKRVWYEYNGSQVAHCVEPFTGERISLVLYNVKLRRKATPQYLLVGSQPVYMTGDKEPESQDSPDQHPQVVQEEDPAEVAARERLLEAEAAAARREWAKIAKAKRWDTIRAPLSVYRHSGVKLDHDPRLEKEYKEKVIEGLRLTPPGHARTTHEDYEHLSDAEVAALTETVWRKAAAFWVPDTPRTTVRFFPARHYSDWSALPFAAAKP